ncbi:MAG TPA: S41 family peptidase [Cyclobacteriaceae bacterium]|nr:S41 family peptidase [Cyclobacteriaceae bacterium]HMV10662.1 S41 family peptidase [Cyclobacteriaceae bacterium]HMV91514.1 S41 family peptidase [Cyclobacteriaceae bacterium]HMX02523.1 S41 family peptidase [Cyclobacteriaceae bacterium]HMX50761.1 S41 family peptidase [Cyclobacteriaceae bacterium]
MKKRLFVFGLPVVALVIFSFTPASERYFEIAKNLDIFATLFKEVNAAYVDEVNPSTLVKTGIDAMLESLDPYTNYIPEEMVEDYRTLNTGQYGGIGAYTREIGGRTVVTMVLQGYAAQRSGLKIGDEVLKIDNKDLSTLEPGEEGHLMKGQVGTPVSLTVKRMGSDKPIKLDFKREKIKISNVPYYGMLENNIGYVQLLEFTPDAGKEVKNAVVALKEKGATSIVLDLRNNPGGLLDEAVNVCNVFIPKGKLVVTTKGKIEHQDFQTNFSPIDTEIPVAVIINRGSASASEIVAGTLQDYDRAVIVGEKSFGKGLVQVSRQLTYKAQLKVTTAKYYTPTGRCIQVLDYSHRREDGSVLSVPDSLKRAFKTAGGRTVYDGGGIDPDVKLQPAEAHPLTQKLFQDGFIFDYATLYAFNHQKLAEPRNFSLSNEEYQQFVNWMKGKNYTYTSNLDVKLKQLIQEAEDENYYTDLKPHIDQIRTKIAENKKNELTLYKDQIKKLLEEDIMARYYLEEGTVQVGFKYDQELKKASEVLLNRSNYSRLLKP